MSKENLDDILEEGDEIIQEQDILKTPSYSKEDFEEQLVSFFTKHRKSKLKFVPEIVKNFSQNQAEVMDYLNYKYVRRVEAIINNSSAGGFVRSAEGAVDNVVTEVKEKSKSKLGLIIGVVVVLLVLAAAAYFFKDKLMGTGEAFNATEQTKGLEPEEMKKEAKKSVTTSEKAYMDSMEAVLDGANAKEEVKIEETSH